jgi:hypothetical protein
MNYRRQVVALGAVTALVSSVLPAGAAPWDPGPGDPPRNTWLADSPWPYTHRNPASQASTPLRGIENSNVSVIRRDFTADSGNVRNDFLGRPISQSSPWLQVGTKKYTDASNSRAMWAVSLTDVYKYEINGTTTRYIDSERVRSNALGVIWNFQTLSGDRIVVQSQYGTNTTGNRACWANNPVLLEFRDGSSINSPIRCHKKFEFTDAVVGQCRGPNGQSVNPSKRTVSASFNAVLYTGEIITELNFTNGSGGTDTYLAVIDNSLSTMRTCRYVDNTNQSNQFAVEPLGSTANAVFIATQDSMVRMDYDSATNTLTRRWDTQLNLRRRTGTTPTLLGFGQSDRFVVIVDAPCAVTNVFTGNIECSDNNPAKLIAIRRDATSNPQIIEYNLPSAIRTVENSPPVAGNDVIIANYGGYKINTSARGVVSVRWDPASQSFQQNWFNGSVQMNGIVTISTASNMVYSSGADSNGRYFFYGLRFRGTSSDPGGAVKVSVQIADTADAPNVIDAGNQSMLNDDRSIQWSSPNGVVRIVQQ